MADRILFGREHLRCYAVASLEGETSERMSSSFPSMRDLAREKACQVRKPDKRLKDLLKVGEDLVTPPLRGRFVGGGMGNSTDHLASVLFHL